MEREWRGTPPLDRLFTGGRRKTKEIETIVQIGLGGDEIPAMNRNGVSLIFLGQIVNRIHCRPHVRPFTFVLFA